MRESLRAELDLAVDQLTGGIARWADLAPAQRASLIRATHATIAAQAPDWVAAAVAAKGGPGPRVESEEWLAGPYAVLGAFLDSAVSLEALARGSSPAAKLRVGTAPGGRATIRVLPTRPQQVALLNGFSAEVWLRPGVAADEARAAAGLGARRIGEDGGVALVLGAGNVTSIGPLDVLNQLVAHNRASVLKVNPTFAGLVGVYRRALAPLIEADLLRIVEGGPETGDLLVHHPGITHVHLTGSLATHDAIVWGTGPEADERRAAGRPLLTKSISSELGCVSPCIVVPGRWSKADLRYQAEHVVTQRLHNAGHNCIATQIVVLSSDWPQRTAFLAEIRRVLDGLARREPWYAGSDRVLAALAESHPQAELHGGCYLVDLPADRPDALFESEFFAPALGHTALRGTGAEFFRAAVAFVNERLEGTLGAGILIAPRERRRLGREFDEILADLRYGGIGINVWTGFVFALACAPWGAYPGHSLADAGSGIGVVHNSFLLSGTERTVAEGPFRPFPRSLLGGELALFPKPPWFVTARSAGATGRRLTAYAAAPGWGRLLNVLPAAFRA